MDAEPSQYQQTEETYSNLNTDEKMSLQIGVAISNLISPNQQDRKKGQQLLEQYQKANYSQLLRLTILSIRLGQSYQDKRLRLQFLRGKLHTYSDRSNMPPDLTLQFERLVTITQEELRSLAVQCMNIYLSRPQIDKFKKNYIDNLVKKLDQSLQKCTSSGPLIERATDILGHSLNTKKSNHKYSNNTQRLLQNILRKGESERFVSKKWVRFILALLNYTGFAPSIQFVYRNLVSKQTTDLGVQEILRLTQKFNYCWVRFNNICEIYEILKAQVQRLQNKQFMLKLNIELEDEDSFGTIIKSIENAITFILRERSKNFQPLTQQSIIYEEIMNVNFLYSMTETLLSIPDLTTTDKIPIYQLINTTIILYEKNLKNKEQIFSYSNALCQKLQTKGNTELIYVYELMENISPSIMKYFPYPKVIQVGFNNLKKKNWVGHIQYLRMVASCLRNLRRASERQIIMPIITNLITYFQTMNLDFCTLNFKSLFFSIKSQHLQAQRFAQTTLQPNQELDAKFAKSLKRGFLLLQQIFISSNTDQECTQMVFEEIWHLCMYQTDFQALVNKYFDSFIESYRFHQKTHLHLKFVKYMAESLNTSCLKYETVLTVVKVMFELNIDILNYECSSLVLQVLVQINKQLYKNRISPTQTYQILKNILNTKLLTYIQQKLKIQKDEPLFSKILMQLIIHKDVSMIIKQMLMRVVVGIQSISGIYQDIPYDFDRVWQAMVILYGEQNAYVKKKRIIQRVDKIRMGQIQSMLETMGIEDQEIMKTNQINSKDWSNLPDVHRVIQTGSIVGQYINKKLHEHQY